MNPEILDRNIYSELPTCVSEFSGKLESLAAELIEEKEKSAEADNLTLPYGNKDPANRSRAGGPVVILPQNERYHQFDTLTHLDIAALYAKEYKEVLLPLLTAHSAEKITALLDDVDTTSFVVATQLHDIEKVFWVTTVNDEHVWKKASTRVKLNLLNLEESEDFAKPKIQRHFLVGDNEFTTGNSSFDSLAGYFSNAGVDAGKSLEILEIYSVIDKSFIESGDAKIDDGSFTSNFLKVSKDKETSDVIFGILTMMCDNLAQGDPPGKNEEFEGKVRENIRRCQLLLDVVLSEHD